MKIGITGGNGFIGSTTAKALRQLGHEAKQLSRRNGGDVGDPAALLEGFARCDAVVHAAGINRELGDQTYARVHVQGTRNVVEAAGKSGVRKIVLLSFLRARAHCGSDYHESKFAAEQIVRNSGLDYTVFKPGVIFGRGDHMLDHLKRAFTTFPLFAFVGCQDQLVAPVHGDDMAQLIVESLTNEQLNNGTFPVVGPEVLTLREAVLRVASVVGRKPLAFPMPIWFHRIVALGAELLMQTPVVSKAQVRILSEGVVEPAGIINALPEYLRPKTMFTTKAISDGLPDVGRYTLGDLRHCCN